MDPISVGGRDLAVWPEGLKIENWMEPSVKLVRFPDIADYHPALRESVLGLEQDPHLAKQYPQGHIGSGKVFHLERWDSSAAALIHARAQQLFRLVLASSEAVVDLSWSSIYRAGDYCLPHSHNRSMASIVYFLDLGGDDDPSGTFCFADPRMKVCCRDEAHCMTTPCGPQAEPGLMIIFPGQLIHFVDIYRGAQPRITLSWNINKVAIPGQPPY